jgi:hypothetical protein
LNWRDPLNLQVVASGGHTGKTPSQLAVLGAEVHRPLTVKKTVNARDPLGIDPVMVSAAPVVPPANEGPQPLISPGFLGGIGPALTYHHNRKSQGSRDRVRLNFGFNEIFLVTSTGAESEETKTTNCYCEN